MIDDYVEFEDGHNDVGDVLRKVRDFQLKSKNGKHMAFKVKIVRHHSQKHDEYMLIMQDEEEQRNNDTVMAALRENFEGHAALDSDTGLPDRSSFEKGVDLVILHRENIANGVCVALFELDDYDQILARYGINACHKAMQDIAALCRQNLRGNDVVAQFDKNRLALILVGTAREPAKIVLNRLRWLIAGLHIRTEQGIDVNTTVSVLFHDVDATSKPEKMLQHIEQVLNDKPKESTNVVVEA
jgi:diguanylate cyclase (GGDEF)-like protein